MSAAAPRAALPTSKPRRAWNFAKKAAPWVLGGVVLTLVAMQARSVDWGAAWKALKEQPPLDLATAFAMALLSYATFACYDLIGRRIVGHGAPVVRTLRIAAMGYAFNLNLGALVGALAMKVRLYGRAGVDAANAGRVIATSMLSNWLGYFIVAGAVLAIDPPPLPDEWPVTTPMVRGLGALLLVLAAVYIALTVSGKVGTLSLRGHTLELPTGRIVGWQVLLSTFNWSLMGAIVWLLLQQRVDYTTVLAVLLLAAVAGVVTHVPAGLGVIEAVFVASLGDQVPQGTLIAALLAYRAVYYLLPLGLATLGYLLIEAAGGNGKGVAPPAAAPAPPGPRREASTG